MKTTLSRHAPHRRPTFAGHGRSTNSISPVTAAASPGSMLSQRSSKQHRDGPGSRAGGSTSAWGHGGTARPMTAPVIHSATPAGHHRNAGDRHRRMAARSLRCRLVLRRCYRRAGGSCRSRHRKRLRPSSHPRNNDRQPRPYCQRRVRRSIRRPSRAIRQWLARRRLLRLHHLPIPAAGRRRRRQRSGPTHSTSTRRNANASSCW